MQRVREYPEVPQWNTPDLLNLRHPKVFPQSDPLPAIFLEYVSDLSSAMIYHQLKFYRISKRSLSSYYIDCCGKYLNSYNNLIYETETRTIII